MRRSGLFLAALVMALAALSGTAGADPKGGTLALSCEGIPSTTISINTGNGAWTPGFDLASTGVYIPYRFTFEAFFTPEGGDEFLLFSGSEVKRNVPNNAKSLPHGMCTFSGDPEVIDDPELGRGTIRFSGSVLAFYTGR